MRVSPMTLQIFAVEERLTPGSRQSEKGLPQADKSAGGMRSPRRVVACDRAGQNGARKKEERIRCVACLCSRDPAIAATAYRQRRYYKAASRRKRKVAGLPPAAQAVSITVEASVRRSPWQTPMEGIVKVPRRYWLMHKTWSRQRNCLSRPQK